MPKGALSEEDEETAEILFNVENEGIEFNYETGEIIRVGGNGERENVGDLADVSGFRLSKDESLFSSYQYVVAWKDPLRPVLAFSPFFNRPDHLDVYREAIVPRLEALLSEYRERHPQPARAAIQPLPSRTTVGGKPLFHFNGWSMYEPTGSSRWRWRSCA